MNQPVEPIWLRPESATLGRPAERSRAEITAAAIALADTEGLTAVSMRRVATRLDTGAASLYRYVATREDLLDLMTDTVAGDYELPAPTGDPLADLREVGHQTRRIMLVHPWLPDLVTTRPRLGPHGVDVLDHVLHVLQGVRLPGPTAAEIFSLLTGTVAMFVHNELHGGGIAAARQQGRYLRHVADAGTHPRISALMTTPAEGLSQDNLFDRLLVHLLSGLLNPLD